MGSQAAFSGFYDEIEKISKAAGPGSRGGKVVGYRKSGKPIYASEKDDKVPMKKPPVVARAIQGAAGLGLVSAQLPLAARYAKGRTMAYHGTPLSAAASIMSSEKGIDPAYAGVGKRTTKSSYLRSAAKGLPKSGKYKAEKEAFEAMSKVVDMMEEPAKKGGKEWMINRHLMAESLNRALEKNKVPLTHEQLVHVPKRFHELMDSGLKSGPAAEKVYAEVTADLIRDGKMKKDVAAKIKKNMADDLSRFGQRVYMGYSPADVAHYSSGKAEMRKAMEGVGQHLDAISTPKGKVVAGLKATGEIMTGGLPTTIKNTIARASYKPTVTETMTGAQAQKELAALSKAGKNLRVVFGASVPTAQMGYLEDFPVVRHILSANPGLKHYIKDLGIKTYEAGNDLSFPHNIPKHNIKSVDLISKSGKIRRLLISDSKIAARSAILKRARGLAIPTALTALGGMGIYRAFKPKKKMVHKTHPLAEKMASVASDVGQVAKVLVPMALVGGGMGYGTHKLIEKAIPKRYPTTTADQLKEVPRQGGRMFSGSLANILGGSAIGAGIGALVPGKRIDRKTRSALGALGGYMTGAMFGNTAFAGREAAMTPETDPYYSMLPDKAQDWVRRNPGVGSVRDTAVAAALPLGAIYGLRKYYPSIYARGMMKAKDVVGRGW